MGGFTNTSGALRTMFEMYTGFNNAELFSTRKDARDVALLITDGYSNVDAHR